MGYDQVSKRIREAIDEIADLLGQAAAQESRQILEKAVAVVGRLANSLDRGGADTRSDAYVQGVDDTSLGIISKLRNVFLPQEALELAQRQKDVLKTISTKSDIKVDELAKWVSGSSLTLDELYDKHLIEPVASPEDGVRLTYAGHKALRLIEGAAAPTPALASIGVAGADQPSAAGSGSETAQKLDQILRQYEEIEASTRSLFDLGRSAAELCAAIDSQFGFDFSAVQLERRGENTIETVAGTGVAKSWVGLAKHRIEKNFRLRDIQADIFKERRVEIVVGMDDPILERLDPFIGSTFNHEELVRVFVPLVLVRDADGKLVTDTNVWQPIADGRSGSEVLKLELGQGLYATVIGTVEAGFEAVALGDEKVRREITPDLAEGLANFVTRYSWSVYQNTLTCVLERVADMALRLAGADVATVQWGTIGEDKTTRRWQTVGAGQGAQRLIDDGEALIGAIGGAPRQNGLGFAALKDGEPKYIDKMMDERNRSLYDQGVRAMAVYPSAKIGNLAVGQKVCLIYTHFREERTFTQEELNWVHHLTRRSGAILPMAFELAEGRDHQRQLETIQRVVSSFTDRNRHKTLPDLLKFIAWSTLNLHGADVVTIYYSDPERPGCLVVPPTRAGRLRHPKDVDVEVKDADAPMRVLASNEEPFFVSNVANHPSLDQHGGPNGFVARERIRSTAALRLVVRNETPEQILGVMFVNYREPREFTRDDKSRLILLASLSAMALKNFEMHNQELVAEKAIAELVTTSLQVTSQRRRLTPMRDGLS